MRVLVTGATGFVGSAAVRAMLTRTEHGLICQVRTGSNVSRLQTVLEGAQAGRADVIVANLLSRADSAKLVVDADAIIHCAAGMGGGAANIYMNTVVATRNLLDAMGDGRRRRLVLVSSFAVYGTAGLPRGALVNEETPIESHPERRDGYALAKLHQEEIVREYAARLGFDLVVARPGVVYGPGGYDPLSARIGLNLPGLFLSMGGNNLLPLSYVDNCADALVVAATAPQAVGLTLNLHDDDLRTCREYLRRYRVEVRSLRTLVVPYPLLLLLSAANEWYHRWSRGQLPAALTVYRTRSLYVGRRYDNERVKSLGWRQSVSTQDGLQRTFEFFRQTELRADPSYGKRRT
ncbi:MAG: NAD(P)-dependent oxidoreductase [Pseudomonadota bacterium]|nr:NAD(P)-dependent oxidoreductase [Pseudomonadota bacterium]